VIGRCEPDEHVYLGRPAEELQVVTRHYAALRVADDVDLGCPGRGPLLAWLQTRSIGQTAARPHIHPQTARYRMNQLRGMFGPALDDPDTRFELEMALRARQMLRAAR
jgi:PucR C-terminal helix-turn-helix domain